MLTALTLSDVREFISDRDPDKKDNPGNATVFKLGAIPSRVYAQIKDKASGFVHDPNSPEGLKAVFNGNDTAVDIVRFGLKGFERYQNKNGKLMEFKTVKEKIYGQLYDVVHPDIMACIDLETIRELAFEIRRMCEVDEVQEKNSEG